MSTWRERTAIKLVKQLILTTIIRCCGLRKMQLSLYSALHLLSLCACTLSSAGFGRECVLFCPCWCTPVSFQCAQMALPPEASFWKEDESLIVTERIVKAQETKSEKFYLSLVTFRRAF